MTQRAVRYYLANLPWGAEPEMRVMDVTDDTIEVHELRPGMTPDERRDLFAYLHAEHGPEAVECLQHALEDLSQP